MPACCPRWLAVLLQADAWPVLRRYTSGFFGKWHLGVFTTLFLDGNRGGTSDVTEEYVVLPSNRGISNYTATEAKVRRADCGPWSTSATAPWAAVASTPLLLAAL